VLFFKNVSVLIKTTGEAGGMHQPLQGILLAEPIGSLNSLPTAALSQATA